MVEKTVRRAARAWFISEKEMGARPPRPSEVSSLGKLRVFSNHSIATLDTAKIPCHHGFRNASEFLKVSHF